MDKFSSANIRFIVASDRLILLARSAYVIPCAFKADFKVEKIEFICVIYSLSLFIWIYILAFIDGLG